MKTYSLYSAKSILSIILSGLGIIFLSLILNACLPIKFHGNQNKPLPSHAPWTAIVKKYVNEAGLVDYKGIKDHKNELQPYLDSLTANPPADNWTDNEKIAYWLNAYNAFTVKLIIDNYPLKSIKDLGPKNQVIFINTPWDEKFFKIGNKTMTLNRIEHRILRKLFTEPRIHFALNCASMSCPKLRREAYEAKTLDAQLTEQAKEFLSDPARNKITAEQPQVSSIFKWYGKDMTKWSDKSLVAYINQYAPVQIKEGAELSFMDYDWSLNDQ